MSLTRKAVIIAFKLLPIGMRRRFSKSLMVDRDSVADPVSSDWQIDQ
jgi:hypothetical protein